MLKYAIIAGFFVSALYAGKMAIDWTRQDAVRDFVLEAAIAQAKADAGNLEDLERITDEVENSTVDELRARAAAGGMFLDEGGTSTD